LTSPRVVALGIRCKRSSEFGNSAPSALF
jgi:hypothetical protein